MWASLNSGVFSAVFLHFICPVGKLQFKVGRLPNLQWVSQFILNGTRGRQVNTIMNRRFKLKCTPKASPISGTIEYRKDDACNVSVNTCRQPPAISDQLTTILLKISGSSIIPCLQEFSISWFSEWFQWWHTVLIKVKSKVL